MLRRDRRTPAWRPEILAGIFGQDLMDRKALFESCFRPRCSSVCCSWSGGGLHDLGAHPARPGYLLSHDSPKRCHRFGGIHLYRFTIRRVSEPPARQAHLLRPARRAAAALKSGPVLPPGRLRPLLDPPAYPYQILLAGSQVASLTDVHVLARRRAGDGAPAVSCKHPVHPCLSHPGHLPLVDGARALGAGRGSERLAAHERDVAILMARVDLWHPSVSSHTPQRGPPILWDEHGKFVHVLGSGVRDARRSRHSAEGLPFGL